MRNIRALQVRFIFRMYISYTVFFSHSNLVQRVLVLNCSFFGGLPEGSYLTKVAFPKVCFFPKVRGVGVGGATIGTIR